MTYAYQSGSDLLTSLSMGGVVQQTLGYTADGRLNSLNPGMESPGNQLISSATYNQDARLASFNSGGEPLASYTYDGFGQRLLKTVSSTYGNIYQYDQSGMLLEETDASGVAQADYIYLNGRPIAVLDPSSATLSFLNDDRLGAPQLATDSGQNIVWQATYDPFGQTPTLSGTITQNLRLPGQYFDQESGFYHNGFRDYLPSLGRYAEPDPLGRLGSGNNLFVYVGDNPTNLTDPLGLCPLTCHDLAAGRVPNSNFSKWWAGYVNASSMLDNWLAGTGPTDTTFGPNSPESQEMMGAYGLAGNVNSFLNGGPSSGWQNFGVGGLLASGLNPTTQFVGSYGWSMSVSDGYLDITLTNGTTMYSAFYHAPGLDPDPPTRFDSVMNPGWHPMGRVNQTFHIRVPCS